MISLVLIVLSLIVFWQTTTFEFVWDDEKSHLTKNPYLDKPSYLWTTSYDGLYVPVSYTIWGFLRPLGQKPSCKDISFDPFVYHLANIILHILNGFLVFGFLRLILRNPWAALGGALLFLLHPIQVESVAWVSEFRGLLGTFFGLSALYLYLIAGRKESPLQKRFALYYASSMVLFILALLSKPSAVVIPVFASLFDIFYFKRSVKHTIIRIFPFLLATLPIILITRSAQSQNMGAVATPIWIRPFIWMDAINFYLGKIIYPLSLANSYARTPGAVMSKGLLYIEWLAPLSLAYILWRLRKSFPVLGLSFLVFLIGFLPVSGLIQFTFQKWSTVADRYIYLSMSGTALAFAYVLSRVRRKVVWILSAGLIVFWGGWSHTKQTPVWRDSLTLWNHCLQVTPMEAKAYINRGNVFKNMKEYHRAIGDYDKGIEIDPQSEEGYFNRGLVLAQLREFSKAISDYNKAIEIDPRDEDTYINRGNVFKDMKEYHRAITDYDKALEINPQYAEAFYNKGVVFAQLKEYRKAIRTFSKAIEINSRFADAYYNRGLVLGELKEYSKALEDFSKALEINPKASHVYIRKGDVYKNLEKYAEAVRNYGKAIEISPNNANAYFSRGVALTQLKKYEEAIRDYSKALAIRPGYLEAHHNRGVVFAQLKKYGEAIKDFSKAIEIDPQSGNAYYSRALAYYSAGDYIKSLRNLRQAQSLGIRIPSSLFRALLKALGRNSMDEKR